MQALVALLFGAKHIRTKVYLPAKDQELIERGKEQIGSLESQVHG